MGTEAAGPRPARYPVLIIRCNRELRLQEMVICSCWRRPQPGQQACIVEGICKRWRFNFRNHRDRWSHKGFGSEFIVNVGYVLSFDSDRLRCRNEYRSWTALSSLAERKVHTHPTGRNHTVGWAFHTPDRFDRRSDTPRSGTSGWHESSARTAAARRRDCASRPATTDRCITGRPR